jgi:hypothetical protein
MPGVTIASFGPTAARIRSASSGDATTPSQPSSSARRARAITRSAGATSVAKPRSRRSSGPMLVNSVTARMPSSPFSAIAAASTRAS